MLLLVTIRKMRIDPECPNDSRKTKHNRNEG